MNTLRQGQETWLKPDGLFFLPTGSYLVWGSLSGTNVTVQTAIAPINTSPLIFSVNDVLAQTPASRNGDNIFFDSIQVLDQGNGGSLLGIYQYSSGSPESIPVVGRALPEVYASFVFIPQSHPLPELSLTQSSLTPATFPDRTWTPLWLDASSNNQVAGEASPQGGYSFCLGEGTYLVTGMVGASSSGSVSCIAVTDQTTSFSLENVLLVSAGGSRGDPEFQGVVEIPKGGALVGVFAFCKQRETVGVAANSQIRQLYANLNFSPIATVPGSSRHVHCCHPLTPLTDNFVVSQTLPSGASPENSLLTNPNGSYRRVLLNSLSGLPSSSLRSGAFLLPRGSWYVQGVTTGSKANMGAALASVDPNVGAFEENNIILQASNCIQDNGHLNGIISVQQDTWVALFTSVASNNNPFGDPLTAGVPEIYSRLLFLRAPVC